MEFQVVSPSVKLVALTQPVQPFYGESAEDLISYCARVSNPRNQDKFNTAQKLLSYCRRKRHWSVFEMANMVLEIVTTRDIARQILRHRSFHFQEFCIAGSSIITMMDGATPKPMFMGELFEQWDAYKGKLPFHVRAWDNGTQKFISVPVVEVKRLGVKNSWTLMLRDGKKTTEIRATKEHRFMQRDRGFVQMRDLEPGDYVAVDGSHENSPGLRWYRVDCIKTQGRIMTYDMEVEHDSHNYVANGIVTHNSQRYAQVTETMNRTARGQDTENRQNSIVLEHGDPRLDWWQTSLAQVRVFIGGLYDQALQSGIAKENARTVLPEGLAVTRMYMNGTVRDWFHYCQVRTEYGVQAEHREIAQHAQDILYEQFPAVRPSAKEIADMEQILAMLIEAEMDEHTAQVLAAQIVHRIKGET